MGKLSVLERWEQWMIAEAETKKCQEEEALASGPMASQIGTSRAQSVLGEGSGKGINTDPPDRMETIRVEESGNMVEAGQFQQQSWKSPEEKNEPMMRRMEIPIFNGENAESWVLRVEQYFQLDNFSDPEKLQAVRICFNDEALMWYRWERDRNPFPNWEQLKYRVLE